MATRKAKVPVKPSENPENLLSGLQASAKQQTRTVKKPARETMGLSDGARDALEHWAMANAVAKIADSQLNATKADVEETVWAELTDQWVVNQARPSNPQLTTARAKAIFQIREKFSVNIPKEKTITDLLMALGFSEEIASTIEQNEVSIEQETTLLPFEAMFYSDDPKMKGLATKLMKLVQANFDEEERSLILQSKNKVKVTDHFLDRAASYCENGEELRNLLTVIKPEHFPSHGQCVEGLDMNTVYQEVLGAGILKKEEEYQTTDGSYRMKRKDKSVEVFMRGKPKPVAVRVCNDAGHANHFCMKMVRDSAFLVESLDKYKA